MFPLTGEKIFICRAGLVFRAWVWYDFGSGAAVNSPPVPFGVIGWRRTRQPILLENIGGDVEGVPPMFLLVQAFAELVAELVKRLALVREDQQPEPFRFLRLLHK